MKDWEIWCFLTYTQLSRFYRLTLELLMLIQQNTPSLICEIFITITSASSFKAPVIKYYNYKAPLLVRSSIVMFKAIAIDS